MTRLWLLLAVLPGCATLSGGGHARVLEDNKSAVRAFTEQVYNQKKLDRLPFFVSADYQDSSPGASKHARGLTYLQQQVQAGFDTFPDAQVQIEQLGAEDDLVFLYWTAKGTEARSRKAGKPKQLQLAGHSLYRLREGKIVEAWDIVDRHSALKQLGFTLVPPAP